MARIPFLMYHELELAGRKLCQSEPGYVRYILPLENFRSQMECLKQSGFRGRASVKLCVFPQNRVSASHSTMAAKRIGLQPLPCCANLVFTQLFI